MPFFKIYSHTYKKIYKAVFLFSFFCIPANAFSANFSSSSPQTINIDRTFDNYVVTLPGTGTALTINNAVLTLNGSLSGDTALETGSTSVITLRDFSQIIANATGINNDGGNLTINNLSDLYIDVAGNVSAHGIDSSNGKTTITGYTNIIIASGAGSPSIGVYSRNNSAVQFNNGLIVDSDNAALNAENNSSITVNNTAHHIQLTGHVIADSNSAVTATYNTAQSFLQGYSD